MKSGIRTFLSVFFLFILLISSFYPDVWKNANTTSRALPIITFFESGTFRIDKYHELTVDKALVNGHYYTDKAPLPTYVVLPFFGFLKWVGLIAPDAEGNLFGDHVYLLGGFLTASLPFSLVLLFLFNRIRKTSVGLSPVLLATFPFIASFIFVFTGTFFPHIFSGASLLVSYLCIRDKRYILAGLAGGMAFLSEYNLAVILFLWGVLILVNQRNVKPFLGYATGILPSLLFLLVYNSIYSSSPFTFMYKHHNFSELDTNYGFILPGLDSIWGLSFSAYRGIFFYAPFLLAGLYIVVKKFREGNWKKLLTGYLFLPFALYFLLIASYFGWWGGWTYGPRLLLAILLVVLYRMTEYLSVRPISKVFFNILSIAGLILIIPAKGTIAYSAPTGILNPFNELVIGGIRSGDFNPNNLLTLCFGIEPGVAFLIFIVLFIAGFTTLTCWYRKWQPAKKHM
jgi:hypothetical protein